VSYSDHYEEKGVFERLMDRLRRIALRTREICASDAAGLVLKNISAGPSRAVHSTLCAGRKRNGAGDFDAETWRERTLGR